MRYASHVSRTGRHKGETVQIADVVRMTDIGLLAVVVNVEHYCGLTVYAVMTLGGTVYSREADQLTDAPTPDAAEFEKHLRILAPHHPELRRAVELVDSRDQANLATQVKQVATWMASHDLDKSSAVTAEDVFAARDADHEQALELHADRPLQRVAR